MASLEAFPFSIGSTLTVVVSSSFPKKTSTSASDVSVELAELDAELEF